MDAETAEVSAIVSVLIRACPADSFQLHSAARSVNFCQLVMSQCSAEWKYVQADQVVKYSIEASFSINTGMETTRRHLAD